MMNLMTVDKKVEELQNIIDQRDHNYSKIAKENNQISTIKQLEFRLNEVMKVNKALIDELHDKNYVNQEVKTRLEEEYLQTENRLGAKISNVIEKWAPTYKTPTSSKTSSKPIQPKEAKATRSSKTN